MVGIEKINRNYRELGSAQKIVQRPCVAQEFVQSLPMGKAERLKAKIMNPDQVHNVTFAEAVSVLERAGFVWDLGTGSHQVYRHPDGRRITLPKHGNLIKPIYVSQIRDFLR
jgi:predicted RNA binding protein YcfA (HicA-like mRNA interferase family)